MCFFARFTGKEVLEKLLFVFLLLLLAVNVGTVCSGFLFLEVSLYGLLLEFEEGFIVVVLIPVIFDIVIEAFSVADVADVISFLVIDDSKLAFLRFVLCVLSREGHDGQLYLVVIFIEIVSFLEFNQMLLQAVDLLLILEQVFVLDLLLNGPI